MGNQVHTSTSSLSGFLRFIGSAATGEEQGAGDLGTSVAGDTGPQPPFPLLVVIGVTPARRLELCALPTLLLPGYMGLWA